MDPMQFLGVMQQELEHQRQLMELMQQMQQQMRQMQHQEQQAHEAQTQQRAPPSGGNERQSQQLIMKGFYKIDVFSVAELVLGDQDCCVGDERRVRRDANYGRNGRNREH